MLRKDREVTDIGEIADILSRCDTIRLGLNGEKQPYIVPLSFGFELCGGVITLYFHGSARGFKHVLIAEDDRVCVEADRFIRYDKLTQGITTRYESVIGFGKAQRVSGEEQRHGLALICAHCGFPDYDVTACGAIEHTAVYKITLESVSGKHNLGN